MIDIPAGQNNAEAQARALKDPGQQNDAATCTFTPTKHDPNVQTNVHVIKTPVDNTTNEEQETTIGATVTVSVTDGIDVGLSTEVNIAEVVKLAVGAKHGHQWTTEHRFNQEVKVHIPAHYTSWFQGSEPIFRD